MEDKNRFGKPQFVIVYLMRVVGSDVYKIGYTTNAINLRKYGVKSEVGPVEVVDTAYCDFKHEAILHEKFRNKLASDGIYKMHREYFVLNDSDVSFIMDYFKNVAAPDLVMNRRHPKWKEFLRSISFGVARKPRTCDHTHLYTRKTLFRYKLINIEKSIDLFKENGGLCDCAILNMAENIK